MTEQELIEKIAQREAELHQGYYNRKYGYHRWDKLPPVMRAEIYDNADQIHAIYKEAGSRVIRTDTKGKKKKEIRDEK